MKQLDHLALIPDGNRRWAKEHGVPRLDGHRRGAEAMDTVVKNLITRGVKYLTVWGFSTDNWDRSDDEVRAIFQLLAEWIGRDTPWLHAQGVRLRYIGRFLELPQTLQIAIKEAVELTEDNDGMTLNLAFNYSGRDDILEAARKLASLYYLDPRQINEELFSRYLYTDGIPDVDLVIRTAGEFRVSNFMLWQTAYSEYYFTDVLWPAFNEKELEKALQVYAERQRTFGGN